MLLPTGDLRSEAAISSQPSTQPLPIYLLDGPTADLQELGQFPLAHSLRPSWRKDALLTSPPERTCVARRASTVRNA